VPIPRRAFALLASLTVAFLAAASAPTPLYPLYQAQWGFSALGVTVVFGVYALAVLASLLVFGRLSDHVGRRPVLLVAIGVQILALLLFASASGLGTLLLARVIQGLSTGAAVAALGAGLLDLDRHRGSVANAVTVPIGTALGGIIAGFVVSFLPAPTRLVYLLLGVLLLGQALGVLWMKETVAPRPGALGSLRPRLIVSQATRAPLLRAVPAIVATWALPGFFASLGPALLRGVMGVDSPLASGLLLFAMAGSAGVAVLAGQNLGTRRLMALGAVALAAGLGIISAGLTLPSLVLLFTGAAIAGLGFGGAFQGALRSVVSAAAPAERAGVLSVVFIIAYLAMGLPAMTAGWLVAHDGNLLVTAREFAVLIVVLAALTLVGTAVPARPMPRAA
jgi:MFS family permease